ARKGAGRTGLRRLDQRDIRGDSDRVAVQGRADFLCADVLADVWGRQARKKSPGADPGSAPRRSVEALGAHRSRKTVEKIAAIRLPAATQVMMIATRRKGQSIPGMSAYSEA